MCYRKCLMSIGITRVQTFELVLGGCLLTLAGFCGGCLQLTFCWQLQLAVSLWLHGVFLSCGSCLCRWWLWLAGGSILDRILRQMAMEYGLVLMVYRGCDSRMNSRIVCGLCWLRARGWWLVGLRWKPIHQVWWWKLGVGCWRGDDGGWRWLLKGRRWRCVCGSWGLLGLGWRLTLVFWASLPLGSPKKRRFISGSEGRSRWWLDAIIVSRRDKNRLVSSIGFFPFF